LNGNEYFINAGATNQTGFEAMLKYLFVDPIKGRKVNIDLTNSFSFQPYRFTNYQQGNTIFNGNPLTGVPKYIWVSGFNVVHKNGWAVHLTANMSSRSSLNDAATVYANGYQLVQAKLTKQIIWKQNILHFYIGGDNLLNQTYSLGNDINAVGNRFFNPAPLMQLVEVIPAVQTSEEVLQKSVQIISDWKKVVELLFDKLEIDQAYWMGFSMGAKFLLKAYEMLPSLFSGISILAPDGLVMNPWYKFATEAIPGRLLLQFLIRAFPVFRIFVKALVKLGLLRASMGRFTMSELAYYEAKEQFDRDVLLRPDEYYNAFIGLKVHRNHVKHLTPTTLL
jgi:hypothetical protein